MNLTEVETLIYHWGSEPARRGLPILADRWSGQRKPGSSSMDAPHILKANPGLGWAFANRIVASGRPSPLVKKGGFRMVDAAISLLFAEQRGAEPPPVANIVNRARELDGSPAMRSVLRAALLAIDGTLKSVAAALNLPVEVVTAYHELFFNVLQRKDDLDYIIQIVEGESSRSMAFAREQAGVGVANPLFARVGTVDDVLIAAGVRKAEMQSNSAASESLRKKALAAADAWLADPGNHNKSPSQLVALGLDIVKRMNYQRAPLGSGDEYPSMGELLVEVLKDDAMTIRSSMDHQANKLLTNPTDPDGKTPAN